jgi:Tfp pilus assembly protein PilW
MKAGRQAFSLTELLAGLVVGAIMILMIGAIGTIAAKSYKDLENRSGSDSDAQFALEAIRSAVRLSQAVPTGGTTLRIDSGHRFYLQGTNLFYENTEASPTTVRVLTGISSLNFTVTPPVSGSTLVTVNLRYTKAGVVNNYDLVIARRNP